MVAIRITNAIKNKNPHLAWIQNGNGVVRRANYPNRFFRSENVIGGYRERTDLHEADGWRLFKTLVDGVDYDSATQRLNTNNIVGYPLGENLANTTHYAYKIVDLTQQEIEDRIAEQEDLEDEQQEQQNEDNGLQLIRRTRKRLRRKVKRNAEDSSKGLTPNQANRLRRWFSQIFYHLRNGDWDLAQEDILADTFPTPNNQTLVDEIDWLKARINDYITTEYQRFGS